MFEKLIAEMLSRMEKELAERKRFEDMMRGLMGMVLNGNHRQALCAARKIIDLQVEKQGLKLPADTQQQCELAEAYIRFQRAPKEEKREAAVAYSKLFQDMMLPTTAAAA